MTTLKKYSNKPVCIIASRFAFFIEDTHRLKY